MRKWSDEMASQLLKWARVEYVTTENGRSFRIVSDEYRFEFHARKELVRIKRAVSEALASVSRKSVDFYDCTQWRPERLKVTQVQGLRLSQVDRELRAWNWGKAFSSNGSPSCEVTIVGHGTRRVDIGRLVLTRKLGRPLKTHEYCHHINGDKLDNRRSNLEVKSPSESRFRAKAKLSRSGFRNVHFNRGKKEKPWSVSIRCNGKREFLGLFRTPEEASAVAERRRAELQRHSKAGAA